VSNPESYEDLVELLVPELQKRGLMWNDYAAPGGTYRENMLRTPGQKSATEGHASRDFTYQNLKKYMDADGTIVIDREDADVTAEKESVPVHVEVKETASEKTEETVKDSSAAVNGDLLKVNEQPEPVAAAA
jgi:hypothetical protein